MHNRANEALTPQEWIAHDPDPVTAAELSRCDSAELAARFARPLRFGTAGLRGPIRGGPDAMNTAVVLRASWALARVLHTRGLATTPVVVGHDARHGSAKFATAAAEVFAAQGFTVLAFPHHVPTPVVAFAVRRINAAAGIQITASHNPATDNGYKVYLDGGMPIAAPTDSEVEAAMATAPPADMITRRRVSPTHTGLIEDYCACAAAVRRGNGGLRVALTALHGVGGDIALRVLRAAGIDDIHVVAHQFHPDADFPTVAYPNPEEPGTTDAVLDLADRVGADIAIALDPDADRCAVGIPTNTGWRMLSGDEIGWLLGDYLLSTLPPADAATSVVASSIVSSELLAEIAAHYGVHHVQTLTGFKWLARADADLADSTLVYAYEEALGYCVNPAAVRDKDGISAAVLVCDMVASLRAQGSSITAALEKLAHRHGVHTTAAVTRWVADTSAAAAMMAQLRRNPPRQLAGFAMTVTDLMNQQHRADVVILRGGDEHTAVRVAVRPSGTEPKVKCYIEVRYIMTGGHDRVASYATACTRANEVRSAVVADMHCW